MYCVVCGRSNEKGALARSVGVLSKSSTNHISVTCPIFSYRVTYDAEQNVKTIVYPVRRSM